MCISFEASIAAYTIGVVSGALLFFQNKSLFKVYKKYKKYRKYKTESV